MVVLSTQERLHLFGPLIGGGVGTRLLEKVDSPWGPSVLVHRLIANHWHNTAQAVAVEVPGWAPKRIDSYAPRPIRGSSATSLHAFGLACDFFLTKWPNFPPGGVWQPDECKTPEAEAFRQGWKRRGWRLGAEFARVDLPHIEWASGLDFPPIHPAPPPAPPSGEDTMEYRYPDGTWAVLDPAPLWDLDLGDALLGVAKNGALYSRGPGRDRLEQAIRDSGFREAWTNGANRKVGRRPEYIAGIISIFSDFNEPYGIDYTAA